MLPRFGHQLVAKPPVATQCLAIRPAVPCGRTECAPPRKTPFAYFRAFFPQGRLTSEHPPRGGAGSARPQRGHGVMRGISPLGPRSLGYPWLAMKFFNIIEGSWDWRTERAPRRKPPLKAFGASPAESFPSWDRSIVFHLRVPCRGSRAP